MFILVLYALFFPYQYTWGEAFLYLYCDRLSTSPSDNIMRVESWIFVMMTVAAILTYAYYIYKFIIIIIARRF